MEPVTRKEHFLARIAGKPHDESLFPITREEFFLNDIATNGGGVVAVLRCLERRPSRSCPRPR